MLIPGVDDASHPLEGLSTVLAVGSLVQPVKCAIACVNSLVRRCVSISLNRGQEIIRVVCLPVSPNVEVQPRSKRVDRRRRKTIPRLSTIQESFECVDCSFIRGRPRVAVIVVTEPEILAPKLPERPVVVSAQGRKERPHTVITEPLVGWFLRRRIDSLCFETRSDMLPVELYEIFE
jgi:hypothetical protein